MRTINFVWLLFFLCACNHYPDRVLTSLELAGDNRGQLEEAIRHYRKTGKREKVKAVYFLIANMKDKGTYYNDLVDAEGKSVGFKISDFNTTKEQNKWLDSVKMVRGPLHTNEAYEPDLTHITSGFLISNIDKAFIIRDESPFCRGISDADFYEYILPYRVGYERLEDWRGAILTELKDLKDSIYGFSTVLAAANFVDNYYQSFFEYGGGRYFSQKKVRCYSELRNGRQGTCGDMCNLVVFGLRAIGIPSGFDDVPHKPAWDGVGHNWSFIIDVKTGHKFPFDGLSENGPGLFLCPNPNAPKVKRRQFAIQEHSLKSNRSKIPSALYLDYSLDVTGEYFETIDISINLTHECSYPVYLSIWYKGEWVPIDYYEGNGSFYKARFTQVSKNNLYCITSYNNLITKEESGSFIVNRCGEIIFEQSLGRQKNVSINEYWTSWFKDNRMGPFVYKFGSEGNHKLICKKITPKETGQEWLFAPDSVQTNCFYYYSGSAKNQGRIFVLDNKKKIHWY